MLRIILIDETNMWITPALANYDFNYGLLQNSRKDLKIVLIKVLFMVIVLHLL